MLNAPAYDRFPYIAVSDEESDCPVGWTDIMERLQSALHNHPVKTIVVECYPGVDVKTVADEFSHGMHPELLLLSDTAFLSPEFLREKFDLGNDPVFARMSQDEVDDFFDTAKLKGLQSEAEECDGLVLIVGTGASLVVHNPDVLIYADLARWEIQRRQRNHSVGNLGLNNREDAPSELYRRAFFLDWRVADRLKAKLLPTLHFLLDTNDSSEPKLITGEQFREAMQRATKQPFRVVPFFDPGPWGGHWMKTNFRLPENGSNYAWGFDCVPEENSLLLGFGDRRFEIPAMNLTLFAPQELLGESVFRKFGAEFPIRFDFLDTVGGGNLSLQVHPLRAYIREHFGMNYTQDESYYMFEAQPDATVYLGLQENIDRARMEAELVDAQTNSEKPFPAEQYVNVWPAKRHDHFLIPAGTIHCSGRNGVVLEISATPYIFTFKLWDWGRLGMDGRPRPVHLHHGLSNIQFERTTEWVRDNLIDQTKLIGEGKWWREERTGLHSLQFIETRRHWFTGPTPHHTFGTVNVLNLVEGTEVIVESPAHAFAPFHASYGETFIIPAAVAEYTIRPVQVGERCATIKAFIREDHAV